MYGRNVGTWRREDGVSSLEGHIKSERVSVRSAVDFMVFTSEDKSDFLSNTLHFVLKSSCIGSCSRHSCFTRYIIYLLIPSHQFFLIFFYQRSNDST